MTPARGDVVLVRFPFASGQGSKIRPPLIVQTDVNNARMSNTIVAQITTNTRRAGERTQLLVDPATPNGQSSGLLGVSVVACENLATIEQSRILRKIGGLSATAMTQVDDALKASLELS